MRAPQLLHSAASTLGFAVRNACTDTDIKKELDSIRKYMGPYGGAAEAGHGRVRGVAGRGERAVGHAEQDGRLDVATGLAVRVGPLVFRHLCDRSTRCNGSGRGEGGKKSGKHEWYNKRGIVRSGRREGTSHARAQTRHLGFILYGATTRTEVLTLNDEEVVVGAEKDFRRHVPGTRTRVGYAIGPGPGAITLAASESRLDVHFIHARYASLRSLLLLCRCPAPGV
jgi:hypothetical protein